MGTIGRSALMVSDTMVQTWTCTPFSVRQRNGSRSFCVFLCVLATELTVTLYDRKCLAMPRGSLVGAEGGWGLGGTYTRKFWRLFSVSVRRTRVSEI